MVGLVGDRLQVHPTSVTNTIDRLEADGLVTRQPHPNDRRTTLAKLTSRGRRRVKEAARALAKVDFGLDGMPRRDLNKVDEALTPLRRSAGDF